MRMVWLDGWLRLGFKKQNYICRIQKYFSDEENKMEKTDRNDHEKMIRRLRKPQGRVDVVIDTDTFNEIDDQYALSYLIRSDEKLDLKAI